MTALLTEPPEQLVHGVGFYDSDEDFVATFAPFCRAGVDAGQPTLVRVDAHKADLLRTALDGGDGVEFLDHGDQYPSPTAAMTAVLELVDHHGGGPMRLLGELPPMRGIARDAWVRYEAAANTVLREVPMLAVCPCDTRTTPDAVQAEWLRCHHTILAPGGRLEHNPRFETPSDFWSGRAEVVRDELEARAPDLELADPTPSAARHEVRTLAASAQLPAETASNLLVGVSEVLGNAILHGTPPITLRAWHRHGRVVVAVRDDGKGPSDVLTGFVRVDPGAMVGGLGLWITQQLCPETALSTDDGFTVRIAAGRPG